MYFKWERINLLAWRPIPHKLVCIFQKSMKKQKYHVNKKSLSTIGSKQLGEIYIHFYYNACWS